MKKSISLFPMLVLSGTLLFISCSKKDPEPSKEQLLAAPRGWKLTDVTISSQGVTTSIFTSFDQCIKDNIISFKGNGAYSRDEGATKCNQSDPPVDTGTWSFNADKTIITVTSSFPDALLVVSLTATSLSVKPNGGAGGPNPVRTYMYTAQ